MCGGLVGRKRSNKRWLGCVARKQSNVVESVRRSICLCCSCVLVAIVFRAWICKKWNILARMSRDVRATRIYLNLGAEDTYGIWHKLFGMNVYVYSILYYYIYTYVYVWSERVCAKIATYIVLACVRERHQIRTTQRLVNSRQRMRRKSFDYIVFIRTYIHTSTTRKRECSML